MYIANMTFIEIE